jgi:hypothetical protein
LAQLGGIDVISGIVYTNIFTRLRININTRSTRLTDSKASVELKLDSRVGQAEV